jgi:NADPH:quinone reductase-like Zn-dependent oxidoreductase
MKTLQMQSCVHENATVECALVETTVPEPGPDDVLVAIEASPINPSDLGLMFGARTWSPRDRPSERVCRQLFSMSRRQPCAPWRLG